MLSSRSATERSAIAIGLAMTIVGGLALLGNAMSIEVSLAWPILVVLTGIALFAGALAVGGAEGLRLAIPGGIVAVVGIVLFVQDANDLYATWAYAWALVAPGGAGLAFVLYGAMTQRSDFVRTGRPLLLAGLGLFGVLGLFFEGVLHLSGRAFLLSEPILAGAVIVLGIAISLFGLLRPHGEV
jgi:hypothetical protein